MWLFTKYGFYSIVQDEKDKNTYKVRAREKGDLEQLKNNVVEVAYCSIHQDENADYRYRIFINQEQLQSLLTHLANHLDYSNFKDSIYRNKLQKDKLDSYHKVWDVMYEYQLKSKTNRRW